MDRFEIKLSHARAHLADMCKNEDTPSEVARHFAGFVASAASITSMIIKSPGNKNPATAKKLKALYDSYAYIVAFREIRGTDQHEGAVIPKQHAWDQEIDFVVPKAGTDIDYSRWQEPDFDPFSEVELVETKVWKRVEYQLNEADLTQYGLNDEFSLIGHCVGYLDQLEMMLTKAREQGFIE